MKPLLFGVLSFLFLLSSVPAHYAISPAQAQTIPLTIQQMVALKSTQAGINPAMTACITSHESQWIPSKVGDIGNRNGESYGLFQIEVKQHPDVTISEALDPNFATQWAIAEIKAGNISWWTTWTKYCKNLPIH